MLTTHRTLLTRRILSAFFLCFCLFFVASTMAFAAGAGDDAGVPKETMFTLIKKGGWVMIPLGIASILAVALAAERFISLRREKILPDGFLKGLGDAWQTDPSGAQALQYCDDAGGAAGHVFKAGIQWRHFGYQEVARAIEDAGSREARQMKRSVRGLKAIAAVSPLLGLMGTVLGMISAFQRTATSGGAAKTADLATGIYEALVTTATGLVIAIPTLLVFQYLSNRVDALIDYIDETGTGFIVDYARLDQPSAPAEAAAPAEAVEPVEPVEAAEPVEAVEPVEAIEPAEAVEPVEAVAPVEAVELAEPAEAVAPVEAPEQAELIELVEPVDEQKAKAKPRTTRAKRRTRSTTRKRNS